MRWPLGYSMRQRYDLALGFWLFMTDIQSGLRQAMDINGAIGAAVIDTDSGFCLGHIGGSEERRMDLSGAAHSEVVRAKLSAMRQLGHDEPLEDIIISSEHHYDLIRPLRKYENLFLYLVLHRSSSTLALARYHLRTIENDLEI